MLPPSISLERQVEAMQRAQRHWQSHQEASRSGSGQAAGLTITIAREAGCPGTSVAQEVGDRLGWPVYDHELLERIANEMGLRVSLLESIDERRQSWLLESMEAFAATPHVNESSYVRHLLETILSLGSHGECVIVGRGAAQILPTETTLRVRLIGQLKDRIAAFAARFGLSLKEAARKVEETDRERLAFIKDHFHRDPTESGQYDLVLNTSRWPIAGCADLIIRALHQMQGRVAGQSA
jgi:cytidylate kinase